MNKDQTAFPIYDHHVNGQEFLADMGMTLRQYAAINLRVPNSGDECLDKMILDAMRNEFAEKTMQGVIANTAIAYPDPQALAKDAYKMADAMMEAREK